jgi:hypothetical protein
VADDLGTQAELFYLTAYTIMNIGAFFVIILISNKIGSDDINDYKGLGKRMPILAAALTVFLISLTGLPPTVGFIGKYMIFSARLSKGSTFVLLATAGILTSVVSLYYYFKNKEELFVQVVNNQLTIGLNKLQSDIRDLQDDESKILKYLWNRTQVYTNLVKLTSLSNENILDLNNTFEEIYTPYKKLEISFIVSILSKVNKNKTKAEHDNFAELILDLVNAIGLSALLVKNISNQSQFLEQYNIKKETIVKMMLKAYNA